MSLSKLHCIIDCSGSMVEYGKPMLLVNLVRYIRQFTEQHDTNICYFSWQENITQLHWSVGSDVELPSTSGEGNVDALCKWIERNPDVKFLLLTDGYFKLNAQQRFQLSQLDHLYLIGVGGDADLPHLNTLSNNCYRAEQLDQVLHMILRSEIVAMIPSRRVDLTHIIENESNDDDW
ncbi:MAG: hypothetical protein KAY26_00600 [Acinetobacter sp.]|jgi:hypothetical protein|uniref:VWA domain-containing protein n=1 Tax=Acinetobacter towneri TaxID=202956 RepID=A0A1E8E2H7_9GAMM|nr:MULTISPECIES: hypothetical protein [Acinetobacter]MBP8098950.1 hypothetical protein [Acinetobacter sp.]MCO8113533.1 hypothetical protein [Acinetobacter lwoffii]OFE43779.1 hypothetical protein BJN41_09945 [Acinetobacter towneri]RSC24185.1 hypothetical protein EGS47_16265 [Acinetobacter sp. FDAARGOS_515]